jgi:hypothetical protein
MSKVLDERLVLEETLIELCNSVWFNTLMQLRDRGAPNNKWHDFDNDSDFQFREGILTAHSRVLGRLLGRLGNDDLSLMVNKLKLTKE